DVEVAQLPPAQLRLDEFQDVRVVDAQDPHVRVPAAAAQLHVLRGAIEDLHEGDGARRRAAGREERRAAGTQAREGEAGAAAGPLYQRHWLQRLEDLLQTVADREDEARGELAERRARVHQR